MTQKIKLSLALFGLITNIVCSQPSFNLDIKRTNDVQIDGLTFAAYKGLIYVPENHEDSNSKRIQIQVLLIKSSNKNPQEPVFWFDGGPGGTNIVSQSKIDLPSAAHTLKNHDFVCVGYRGVDGSVKLTSKKITKAFRGIHNNMLSEKSINNIKEKIKNYKTELKEKNIDINNYTILNVIEDVEIVRKQLGYIKINLLSVSYGTRVALLYSYKYPEIINRSLMIGAAPPGYFLARPEQAEEVIDKYDQIYKEQNDTNFSFKDIMKKAFENMPKRWSVFKLDADKIKAGTINALYSVGFAVSVFDTYKKAVLNKDYSGLYMLQKLSDVSHPKVMGDVYAKTVSADWLPGKDYETEIRNANTVLGGNVSLLYASTSNEWDIKPIPSIYQKCQNSATETLIISGNLDHRTPPAIVDKEMMPYLSNGKHIILKNSAHIDILSIVMKNETLLKHYFDTGKIDESKIKVPEKLDFTPKIKISKTKIFLFGVLK